MTATICVEADDDAAVSPFADCEEAVADLGCGSGVLSILASKMGCDNIIAIDNDSICKDNFLENCQLNSTNNIKFHIEDIHKWDCSDCDIILANINKNNILKIIDKFEKSSSKSILIVSGLLNSDLDQILERLSISVVKNIKRKNEWISLVIKNK